MGGTTAVGVWPVKTVCRAWCRFLATALFLVIQACSSSGGTDSGTLPPLGSEGRTFGVSGTISGLWGTDFVVQINVDGQTRELAITANGPFTFDVTVPDGTIYLASVVSQPVAPSQTCEISNASGTVDGADIVDVMVACTTDTFAVGGMLSGLLGTGLTLRNNMGDDLLLDSNGEFSFATALEDESPYNVTIQSQPVDPAQTCAVTMGVGSLAGADVTDVAVVCNQPPDGAIDSPASDQFIDIGDSVIFAATCSDAEVDTPFAHAWDFDGGAVGSSAEDPGAIVFSAAGTYSVSYTCIDVIGDADPTPAMAQVRVNAAPEGAIDIPVGTQVIEAGGLVNFSATCSDTDGDTPVTHLWDFGGGATNSTAEDPGNTTFNTPGTYDVTYTCTDSRGTADPTPASVTVRVNNPPEGTINSPVGAQVIEVGGAVDFTATCMDGDGDTPLTHLWDFDGGATNSTADDPGSTTFNTPGTFDVTYTCSDSRGTADPTPDTVSIRVNSPPDGVIDTPANMQTIEIGGQVNFTATCTDSDGDTPVTHAWDFDGGATNATSEDPGNTTFNTPGTFNVTYTCTDSHGTADPTPASVTVRVNAPPSGTIDTPLDTQVIEAGGQVNFSASCTDSDGDTPVTHAWNFDGGATNSSLEDPGTIMFSVVGVYSVTYTCSDSRGTPDPTPASVTVRVNNPPDGTIDAPASAQVIEAGGAVSFSSTCSDSDGDTPVTHLWDFDGGAANSTAEDPGNTTFNSPGTYDVVYTCSDSQETADPSPDTVTVRVNSPPSGTIDTPASAQVIAPGGQVNFTASCTDSDGDTPVTHVWDFDGGATNSTSEDPGNTTFNTPGTFNVSYTCSDSRGAPDPTPASVSVRVNTPPGGVIDTPASAQVIEAGGSVSFAATCTDSDGDTPVTHAWDFDGGAGNSTSEDPGSVAFNTPGIYSVTYACTDSLGLADSSPDSVSIRVNAPPTGTIDTPTMSAFINEGESVVFTATCSDSDGDMPVTHVWNFDGGATNSTSEDPGSTTFNTPGLYDVTYTCSDSRGTADPTPDSVSVTVNAAPDGAIDTPATNVTINAGESVTFAATCTDPDATTPYTHAWDFDGGATNSAAEDPGATTFSTPGIYSVSYTCTDAETFSDATPATVTVTVNAAPDGAIDSPATNVTINAGQSVSFAATCGDSDNTTPYTHAWDFDGGATNSTTEDPGATTFSTPGIYNVSYTCTDAESFADPTPDTVTVTVATNSAPDGTIETSRLWAVGLSLGFQESWDGSVWEEQSPGPPSDSYQGIAYRDHPTLPGTWVAAGSSGRIVSSADGENWTTRTPGGGATSDFFTAVTENGTSFVIVGYNSQIQSSPDGENWTQQMPDLMSPRNFYNVAYYNGLWVAVGQSGEIQTSPDLSSWTHRTPDSETPDFRGVAGAAGMWVVVGDGASIQTSPDGMTWTRQSAATGFSNRFRGVDYGAGRWVAVGDDAEIQTSPDGVNWTRRSAAGGFFDEFWGVTYSEELSQWLAYGHHGELQVSSDGISWERRHFAGGFSGIAYDIAEGRGPATGSLTVNSGAAVGFSATCTDPDSTTPYTHAWDFDAGASNSTLKDPGAVVFSVPGTYHVSYTCTDGASLADATPAGVMVTVNAAPDCVIDTPSSATAIAVGAQVNFTASCTDPDNMTPLVCKWDFDGGLNSVYIEDPGNRTFNSAGIYDVTLTCMDALGHVDPSIEAVTITVGDPPESTIDTPASDVTINEGEQVSFAATCTDPGGDTPFAHAWDFDGGATNSAAEDPGATTFDAAGIYNVSYTCTDDTGFADPSPAQVMVEVLVPGLPAGVWVVDDDAAPGGDGTSWATAFETLQDAVDAASAGDQVWVAEGTYRPAAPNAVVVTLKDGISLYGGFAGNETSISERPDAYLASNLDGDYLGDDTNSSYTNRNDNSIHVVVAASNAAMNRFVLTRGNAKGSVYDGRGGAILSLNVSPFLLEQVKVTRNNSEDGGAAMFAWNSDLVIRDSVISLGYAEFGSAGVEMRYGSTADIANTDFYYNFGEHAGSILTESSSVTLVNVAMHSTSGYLNTAAIYALGSTVDATHLTLGSDSVTGTLTLYNGSHATILNSSVQWMNDSLGVNTATIVNSCVRSADFILFSPTDSVIYPTDFFSSQVETAASNQVFLDPAGVCVDHGSETVADAAYGALGLDWRNLTANIDGTPDADTAGATDVDMGRHYDPAAIWIRSFTRSPGTITAGQSTTLTWDVNGASECEISNNLDATVIVLDSITDLPAGSTVVSPTASVSYTLTCTGMGWPLDARVSVTIN